jgi:hypothetical protein
VSIPFSGLAFVAASVSQMTAFLRHVTKNPWITKKITGHIILDFLKKSRVFTKKYRDKIHNYPFKYFLWNFITFEKICKKSSCKVCRTVLQ